MTAKQRLAIAALVWVVLVCGTLFVLHLRVNMTESLPRGVYRVSPARGELAVGELVCFDTLSPNAPQEARMYLRGEPLLMKKVVAVAGAVVDVDPSSGVLLIDGLPQRCLPVFVTDSVGRELPHPKFPLVVPHGSVWLGSGHPRGFDSRYFGPVAIGAISCSDARAVMTWEGDGPC